MYKLGHNIYFLSINIFTQFITPAILSSLSCITSILRIKNEIRLCRLFIYNIYYIHVYLTYLNSSTVISIVPSLKIILVTLTLTVANKNVLFLTDFTSMKPSAIYKRLCISFLAYAWTVMEQFAGTSTSDKIWRSSFLVLPFQYLAALFSSLLFTLA